MSRNVEVFVFIFVFADRVKCIFITFFDNCCEESQLLFFFTQFFLQSCFCDCIQTCSFYMTACLTASFGFIVTDLFFQIFQIRLSPRRFPKEESVGLMVLPIYLKI